MRQDSLHKNDFDICSTKGRLYSRSKRLFQERDRRSSLIRIGPAPVSTKLTTKCIAFVGIPIDILSLYFTLGKNYSTLYGLSHHCTSIAYRPPWGCGRKCSAADALVLFGRYTVVSNILTLLSWLWTSRKEYISVTSEAYSLARWSISMKITVTSFFEIGFSLQILSLTCSQSAQSPYDLRVE